MRLLLLCSVLSALTVEGAGISGFNQRRSPVELPAGASITWWSDVRRSMRTSQYEPRLQDDVISANNPAHGFRSSFETHGAVVVSSLRSDPWRWEIGLAGVRPVRPRVNGSRVEYHRGEVMEWYVNSDQGLEHGFIVAKPVADFVRGNSMRLPLRIGGTLQARNEGKRIDFRTADGVVVLRYEKLFVVDARGKALAARMELRGHRLDLVVDVGGAAWPIIVDPLATAANWTAEGNQGGADFGISVASAGDVNGDGFSDVIVGAVEYESRESEVYEGRALVYHGSAAGLSTTANWAVESNRANARLGGAVASAGDVNGDGYDDVIVGASTYTNDQSAEGAAFVYHGSAAGLSTIPNWMAEGNQTNARLGRSVASAGDVNGDGYADVIVGAPLDDNGSLDEGRAVVYHGSAVGLSAIPNWAAEGDQIEALFGDSVDTAGDVNGDGYADVIVGASHYDNGESNEGRVFVYHGSASGLFPSPSWTAEVNRATAFLGSAVASAGDVNGDRYSDVIIAGRDNRAFVYHGAAAGLSGAPNWTAQSNQADSLFGLEVAAGDFNGDGYDDVIVGAPFYDNGQIDEGRAFMYHGSTVGLSAAPSWTMEINQVSSRFGYSVASAGDVNGDGYADVIVGAFFYDNGEVDEGAAFVYHGFPAARGDVNGDGMVSSTDVFYLINYFFMDGPPPVGSADTNNDGSQSSADIFYLINFLFTGGPPPQP